MCDRWQETVSLVMVTEMVAVDDRSQFKHSNGHWVKRDADTGKIMDVKSDEKPFKGVRREK